jgi:hypothetical protein
MECRTSIMALLSVIMDGNHLIHVFLGRIATTISLHTSYLLWSISERTEIAQKEVISIRREVIFIPCLHLSIVSSLSTVQLL